MGGLTRGRIMASTYKSRNGIILSIVALALLSSCTANGDQGGPGYLPEVDDAAILFVHKFRPEYYEEGKQIVVDGFGKAIEASGQTRRTYFLSRADSAEVVAISFFHKSASSSEWLNSELREQVLTSLRPLYREPLGLREYETELIHNTHVTDTSRAAYLPEPGDEVVLFIHQFSEQTYDEGKATVLKEFPRNIEISGQKMRSYFLDRPDHYEVAVATFVHPESDTEAWLKSEEHRETLESLSPLHQVPLQIASYVVESVHNSAP